MEDALAHPRWTMGPKITIDSATMMNKGLEVIEAHYLFGIPYDAIHVVIHPQSIVHSLVEFIDGSMIAQLGPTDMRIPIQYALTYPGRKEAPAGFADLVEHAKLTFETTDDTTFPCLSYAVEAGKRGGACPAVINAANEEAVAAFLKGEIGFPDISELVGDALMTYKDCAADTVEELEAAEQKTRRRTLELIDGMNVIRS
jgi:1-deoxy-D-xylulose-5-phosphate reductoisomerase